MKTEKKEKIIAENMAAEKLRPEFLEQILQLRKKVFSRDKFEESPVFNYLRKDEFYKELISNMEKLDKKYYILETIPASNTYEEQIMVSILYDINKSMIENIKKYEKNIIDYKEFVEIWIHEIKIPISSLVLKCHNNKSKYSNDFLSIVRKIDNYIDEILYYIRSEETEKDFIISEVNIKDIIANKNK